MAPAADTTTATTQVGAGAARSGSRLGELFVFPPNLLGLLTGTIDVALSVLGSDGRDQRWVIVDRSLTRC